jgi:hypothetical protein
MKYHILNSAKEHIRKRLSQRQTPQTSGLTSSLQAFTGKHQISCCSPHNADQTRMISTHYLENACREPVIKRLMIDELASTKLALHPMQKRRRRRGIQETDGRRSQAGFVSEHPEPRASRGDPPDVRIIRARRRPPPLVAARVEHEHGARGPAWCQHHEVAVRCALEPAPALGRRKMRVHVSWHPRHFGPRPAAAASAGDSVPSAAQRPHAHAPWHAEAALLDGGDQRHPRLALPPAAELHERRRPQEPPHRRLHLAPDVGRHVEHKHRERRRAHAVEPATVNKPVELTCNQFDLMPCAHVYA